MGWHIQLDRLPLIRPFGTATKKTGNKSRFFDFAALHSEGQVCSDASYQRVAHGVRVSRVKAGCAENAVVQGLIEMMQPQP